MATKQVCGQFCALQDVVDKGESGLGQRLMRSARPLMDEYVRERTVGEAESYVAGDSVILNSRKELIPIICKTMIGMRGSRIFTDVLQR